MARTVWVSVVVVAVLGLAGCSNSPDMQSAPKTPPTALASCPAAPRCVSSDATKPGQKMPPIIYQGSPEDAQKRLREIVQRLPRTRVTLDIPGYLRAETTSRLLRFVDDVEFLFDAKVPLIHFRSGARVGYYDFGVNRTRMESIIRDFRAAPSD